MIVFRGLNNLQKLFIVLAASTDNPEPPLVNDNPTPKITTQPLLVTGGSVVDKDISSSEENMIIKNKGYYMKEVTDESEESQLYNPDSEFQLLTGPSIRSCGIKKSPLAVKAYKILAIFYLVKGVIGDRNFCLNLWKEIGKGQGAVAISGIPDETKAIGLQILWMSYLHQRVFSEYVVWTGKAGCKEVEEDGKCFINVLLDGKQVDLQLKKTKLVAVYKRTKILFWILVSLVILITLLFLIYTMRTFLTMKSG